MTRAWVLPAGLAVVLLAWNNVVVAAVPHGAYVAVSAAATVVLLAVARASGLTWAQLGLARRHIRAGLRWGGAAFALVAAGCAVAVLIPSLRPLFIDARTAGLDGGELLTRVLLRIPVGTVLWEEVAFRGVLLAVLARVLPLRRAVLSSAAVFGLWHVRPTVSGLAVNGLAEDPWSRAAAVALVCLATAAAGLLFSWLRLRSGSLLAPVLLHLATNVLGTVAAVTAGRLS